MNPPRIHYREMPAATIGDVAPLGKSVPDEVGRGSWDALGPHSPAGRTFELDAAASAAFAEVICEKAGGLPRVRALTLTFGRQALLDALQDRGWSCTAFGRALQAQDREPTDLQRPFDAVLALGFALNAFGSQDIARIVDAMTKQLRPGGVWVCEAPSFYHACRPLREWSTMPEGLLLHEADFDPVECDQLVRHIVVRGDRWVQTAARFRVLTCPEWTRLLQARRLRPVDIRGNWDEETYTDASPRLIVFARKEQGI